MLSYKRFAYYVTPITSTPAADERPSVDPEAEGPVVLPPSNGAEVEALATDTPADAPDVDAN